MVEERRDVEAVTEYAGPPIVVMGVSGSGKSTVGALLATALGAPFHDADDLHPSVNKEKMRAGIPLDDEDRDSWLKLVGQVMRQDLEVGRPPVVACSALKRAYRDLLRAEAPSAVFVHLAGSKRVVRARMGNRQHEFMPNSLLDSQYETLEPPGDDEAHFDADLTLGPAELVALITEELHRWPERPGR
jgi:gluconokinase